jgi:predicted Rossmann fold nucleotide-binding protein DprA/Smf involved in DNA uptake
MGGRSEASLATLLLASGLVDVGAEPLSPKRYWTLWAAVGDPAELIDADVETIRERTRLGGNDAEHLWRLLSATGDMALALERLERQGFTLLTPFDEGYPTRLVERLGDQAPPVLFVAGPTELLSAEGVGIVGSREVSDEGLDVARRAAGSIAGAGLEVISPGSRGVGRASMRAALDAGGRVLAFLAESLERSVREPVVRRAMGEGRACLAALHPPAAHFTTAIAMAKLKLIYASARLTFVVAAEAESGGTWAGATEALRRGYGQVAAWTGPGAGPGNDRLVELGATPIRDVAELLADPPARSGARPDQLRLPL